MFHHHLSFSGVLFTLALALHVVDWYTDPDQPFFPEFGDDD